MNFKKIKIIAEDNGVYLIDFGLVVNKEFHDFVKKLDYVELFSSPFPLKFSGIEMKYSYLAIIVKEYDLYRLDNDTINFTHANS